ncbi:GNAT family N-acetyltransferase [Plesiomonas shigelloides]|uniref:GNAT family N-acetyltransferase n=1 Tax=Plesiomonas shigelloides TaxID=703 RepID=UPI001E30A91C|nr:GNAT family N-acetyltransferase [Plesiomonas shigelloides]
MEELIIKEPASTRQTLESNLLWREQTESDIPFASDLFIQHRWSEMLLIPAITDEQRHSLLNQQAKLQQKYYKEKYPASEILIIEHLGTRIARLHIDRHNNSNWHIIDISLLPSLCGQGIGTAILNMVIKKADQVGSPCSLYVRKDNPAKRLYQRLGFRVLPNPDLELDQFLIRPTTICI